VDLWCCEENDRLLGVIGIQPMGEVDLIRHAYVQPDCQRRGVGAALLTHVRRMSSQRTLVGTWAAADWAIAFYRRHGFELASPDLAARLLERYWTIPRRQAEESVVLADPPF
jgi:N-acetylglutamate synthase-like GNAT family acetyltransferase